MLARFGVFLKTLLLTVALALLAYAALPGASLDLLAKLLAAALGASLLSPLIYPHLRGVRRGDDVLVFAEDESIPIVGFAVKNGVALESGRAGGIIRVGFPDGTEIACEIVSYSGIFTPARARVVQKPFDIKVV
ncbi:MAG: hypothetical protein QXG98_03685 [Candidatus Micrarchaeia archaeon]